MEPSVPNPVEAAHPAKHTGIHAGVPGPTSMWSIYRQLKENRQILS